MHAAAVRLELRIPDGRSLKAKRRVLKALMAQLSQAFGVAVSEVGFQDQWKRATIGVAVVAPQSSQLERIVHSIHRAVLERPEVELLEIGIAYLEES